MKGLTQLPFGTLLIINLAGTPRNHRKMPVFGRPKIIKNLTFCLSYPTFGPGIGTGIAENPPILFLGTEDAIHGVSRG